MIALRTNRKPTGVKGLTFPHVIRNLRALPRNSHGRTSDGQWFPPGLPVWEFEVAFYPSYVTFETDHVRARDGGRVREMIRAKYPDAQRYDF